MSNSPAAQQRVRAERRSIRQPATPIEVRERIRRLHHAEGLTAAVLAERFGKPRDTISRILHELD